MWLFNIVDGVFGCGLYDIDRVYGAHCIDICVGDMCGVDMCVVGSGGVGVLWLFAVLLHSMCTERTSQEAVHGMFKEAIDVEKNFIIDSIPCAMLGMNSELMTEYIQFVADRLLVQLGYEKIWRNGNPFPFMDRGNLECRTNFFESRVAEYSKANVGGGSSHSDLRTFEINDDF